MIYLFDKDEQLIKLIRKDVIKTALQKFELKDGYVSDRLTVEMRMLSDDDLQKVEYMAIQSINDTHDFHYFWIAQKNNTDNITTLVGVQSGIEELQKTVVYDQRPKDQLAKPVIDRLLDGTNWRSRYIGGNQTRSTNFYYISTFEALKKVCSVWGLEMQFFVEMNGNKIGARYIDFKERIGKAVGSRVVYGHNALQILQEVERTNIYTALIGRGKGEETENGGFGRKLTFEDVEWTTPVAKPKGQRYVEIPSMTALYGIKNADGTMRPKIGTIDFQDETDADNLLKLTYEQLVNVSRPQVTFKTSTAYISNAEIGDTIRVVRHDKHIDYETRIFEITFNRLNDQSADIKLGDNIKGEAEKRRIQSAVNQSLDGFVENELKPAFEKLPEFLATADGKNTNWYSDEDPTVQYPGKVLINDNWYKPDPEFEGEKIMLRWTGEVWEEILRTSDPDRIKRSIDQQFEDFNTSYDEAKALQDKQIADVLAKAGANKSLAEEAKRVGDQAKLDAANALSSVQTVKGEAIAEARRLDTIVRKDTETKLATAKSQAIEEAQRLVDGTKGELAQRLSSAETEITKTNDEIKTLAKKSELDTVNNRLSSTESSVNHMSDKIETEISRIEGKIPNEIGGRNLLLNSDFSKSTKGYSFTVDGQIYDTTATNWVTYNGGIANAKTSYHAYVADFEGRKNAIIYNESDGSRNWKGILQILDDRMPQTTNNFILSADVFVTGAGTKLFGGFYYFDKSGKINFHSGHFRFDTSSFEIGKWQRVNVTVPFEKEKADFSKSVRFYIYAYNFGTNAILAIDNVKLETGKIATGHILATEDLTEDIETVKTTITKTAEGVKQLSTKATETDSKISNSETKINQLIGEVSTKVAQRDYDSLLGRVSSAETTIRTQAGQIEQRLTSTQVNQLIDTKGFATTSTVQNIVQNTADSFTQTISRVEGKIPTEIGGRNLWIKKDSYGYSAVESLPSNHITGQSECYRLENGIALIFNIEPNFSSRLYGKVTFTAWVKYENVVQGANAWNVFNCFKHVLYRKNSKTGVTSTADYTALKSFTGTSDWQKITVTYDYGQNTNYDQLKTQLRFYVEHATSGTAWVTGIKVELGSIATDYSLAIEDNITIASFNEVKDTVDTHTRTIGDMQGNISAIAMTASGLIGRVTNAESGLSTVQSQLAGSWAVKNLTSSGAVLNQINLLANGTNRIDGRLTHITGSTLIDNGVIKSAMIGHAQINTAHIGTIDARQANIINLNASNITSGTITGINMRGGVLSAINGYMQLDLLTGNYNVLGEQSAIRKLGNGRPTHFFKMLNEAEPHSVRTIIGSNREGTEDPMTGAFTGIHILNSTTRSGYVDGITEASVTDRVLLVGDDIASIHSINESDGWRFMNYHRTKAIATIEPYNWNSGRSHDVYANNFYLITGNNRFAATSLRVLLRRISWNLQHLKNGGHVAGLRPLNDLGF
ncbi:phage tail spike protein [Streptococcus hyovaginalis]|uniref:phage tail spike protein n=1 Tax=Streptococcus hyovaginalis TaxID=149015 RepID=UPI001478E208|nr:phage tail spike protein [Streptococcus hyovaginalis]